MSDEFVAEHVVFTGRCAISGALTVPDMIDRAVRAAVLAERERVLALLGQEAERPLTVATLARLDNKIRNGTMNGEQA